jgi:hypothetical protein
MNVRTNLMLPEALVEAIDEVAGPRGRSRYVTDVLTHQIRRDRQRAAFEATFGALSPDDYPHWSTSEKIVDWVRERRSETTDPGTEGEHVPDPRLDVRDRPPEGRPTRPGKVASDVRRG